MSGRPRAQSRAGRLPAELTTFLGRAQELAQVKRLLAAGRLVTLTGVGGTGKTRLAVQTADQARRAFPDGAWLVDLAVLSQDFVEMAVAETLGILNASGDSPSEVVMSYLRDRRILLVLDNCEHLLDGCADFVGRALRSTPDLRILCTSRQPLGIPGEYVSRVPPLRSPEVGRVLPDDAEQVYPAIALFVERAAAVSPGFAMTPDNQDLIAAICAKLDGLPLAIELAAARLRTVSLTQLANGLDDRLSSLATRHAVPAHHRTLAATFAWSFELCSPAEQELWTKLSVFADGVDLEAARHVCGGDVLEPISGLVDKSVLLRQECAGRVRYRLLETVREYGQCRLRPHPADEIALRRRHRDWFMDLARRMAADWFGPRQLDWVARVRPERGNIRAALEFCLTAGSGDPEAALWLAASLEPYWLGGGGLPMEGRYWLARALAENPAPTAARAWALACQSRVLSAVSAPQGAPEAAVECLALAGSFDDPELTARAVGIQAVNALVHGGGDVAAARTQLETAKVVLAPYLDTQSAVYVTVLVSEALVHLYGGDPASAAQMCAEAVAYCARRGERWWQATAMMGCSIVAMVQGDLAEADRHLREALTVRSVLGDMLGQALTLDLLATVAALAGRYAAAARILGASAATWGAVGDNRFGSPQFRHRLESARTATRAALGRAAFDEAFRLGQQTPVDEPSIALADPGGGLPMVNDTGPVATLTRREREVVELVAQGLSNREIAAKLTVAVRTAESHVENILRKLQFTSRAQVAVWYAEYVDGDLGVM